MLPSTWARPRDEAGSAWFGEETPFSHPTGHCALPLAEERDAMRVQSWQHHPKHSAAAEGKDMRTMVMADARLARASASKIASTLDAKLDQLMKQRQAREAAQAAKAASEQAERERQAAAKAAADKAAKEAAEALERERQAKQAALEAAEAKKKQEAEAAAAAAASAAAAAAAAAPAQQQPAQTAAGGLAQAVASQQQQQQQPAGAAGAGAAGAASGSSGNSSVSGLEQEWRSSIATTDAEAARAKQLSTGPNYSSPLGVSQRRINMLISQVARVHAVAWEKAQDCLDELRKMTEAAGQDPRAAEEAVAAGCHTLAKRLITQGQMSISPYALAAVALQVGEHHSKLWRALDEQLKATCCYCVPHYVRKPASGDHDEWKTALGYQRKADGKSWESKMDYYNRMAGIVTLYATLLQQSSVGHFAPPSDQMTVRQVANPLGVGAAWRWLARLCNQRPQRVTATILLAFLKPSAHALGAAYPRQFGKLLRLLSTGLCAKLHALIDKEDLPEERAALSNLETWLENALASLRQGQPLTEPEDAQMPAFKEPDNTEDAGGDSW